MAERQRSRKQFQAPLFHTGAIPTEQTFTQDDIAPPKFVPPRGKAFNSQLFHTGLSPISFAEVPKVAHPVQFAPPPGKAWTQFSSSGNPDTSIVSLFHPIVARAKFDHRPPGKHFLNQELFAPDVLIVHQPQITGRPDQLPLGGKAHVSPVPSDGSQPLIQPLRVASPQPFVPPVGKVVQSWFDWEPEANAVITTAQPIVAKSPWFVPVPTLGHYQSPHAPDPVTIVGGPIIDLLEPKIARGPDFVPEAGKVEERRLSLRYFPQRPQDWYLRRG